jgi:hypothetical protein
MCVSDLVKREVRFVRYRLEGASFSDFRKPVQDFPVRFAFEVVQHWDQLKKKRDMDRQTNAGVTLKSIHHSLKKWGEAQTVKLLDERVG